MMSSPPMTAILCREKHNAQPAPNGARFLWVSPATTWVQRYSPLVEYRESAQSTKFFNYLKLLTFVWNCFVVRVPTKQFSIATKPFSACRAELRKRYGVMKTLPSAGIPETVNARLQFHPCFCFRAGWPIDGRLDRKRLARGRYICLRERAGCACRSLMLNEQFKENRT